MTPPALGRAVRIGVLAAAVSAAAAASVHALLVQPFGSGDEAAHLDYAYRVWHGSLPEFSEGLAIHPPVGFAPPVQWVAQHPPLYYLILAPVVGPLTDRGELVAALYAARAVNALLAGLLVVVSAWAAAQIAPRSPRVWLITAGVVGGSAWVARVAGAVYNDVLAAATTTLVLGVAAWLIRRGPTLGGHAVLAGAAALALLTRASALAVIAAAIGGVALTQVMRVRSARGVAVALGAAAATAVAAVVPSAWFWRRNLELTGSLLGGHPDWAAEHLGRVPRPWSAVLVDPATWHGLWRLFSYQILRVDLATPLLLAVPVALALVAGGRLVRRDGPGAALLTSPERTGIGFALAGSTATVLALQILYVSGGGSVNARYLLPVILPVALAIAAGLAWPRSSAWLVAGWLALATVEQAIAVVLAVTDPRPYAHIHPWASAIALAVTVLSRAVVAGVHGDLAGRRDPEPPHPRPAGNRGGRPSPRP
jgi:hypothetical protein